MTDQKVSGFKFKVFWLSADLKERKEIDAVAFEFSVPVISDDFGNKAPDTSEGMTITIEKHAQFCELGQATIRGVLDDASQPALLEIVMVSSDIDRNGDPMNVYSYLFEVDRVVIKTTLNKSKKTHAQSKMIFSGAKPLATLDKAADIQIVKLWHGDLPNGEVLKYEIKKVEPEPKPEAESEPLSES